MLVTNSTCNLRGKLNVCHNSCNLIGKLNVVTVSIGVKHLRGKLNTCHKTCSLRKYHKHDIQA